MYKLKHFIGFCVTDIRKSKQQRYRPVIIIFKFRFTFENGNDDNIFQFCWKNYKNFKTTPGVLLIFKLLFKMEESLSRRTLSRIKEVTSFLQGK
jgi:hypothetical protein